MAMEEQGIKLVIEGLSEFNNGMQDAQKSVDDVGSATEDAAQKSDTFSTSATKLGDVLSVGLKAAAGVAVAGLAALGAVLWEGVQGAIEAEKVTAQLEAVIKSTGGAAGLSAEEVIGFAEAIAQTSVYEDDAILKAQNLLLTFTNIGEETFPMATQALVDMAAAMGTDVSAGAIQLGKALNDPVAGISALTRVGVVFTAEQEKLIKSLVATGDVAGAQRVILEELNKEFGGSAAAQLDTFAGRWQNLQNQLNGIAEDIGAALLPILRSLMEAVIVPLVPMLQGLGDAVTAVIGEIAAGNLGGILATVQETLYGLLGPLGLSRNELNAFGAAVLSAFEWLQQNLPLIGQTFATVFGAVSDVILASINVMVNQLVPALFQIVGAIIGPLPDMQTLFVAAMTAIGEGASFLGNLLSTVVIPAFGQLYAWIADNVVPIIEQLRALIVEQLVYAFQFAAQTWAEVLQPALSDLWTFVQANVIPILADAVTWLQTNIPVALQAAATWINTVLRPALADMWTYLSVNVIPILQTVVTWLQTNVPIAIQATADFFNNTLLPALTAVWNFTNTYVIPIVTALAEVALAAVNLAMVTLAQTWSDILYPALNALATSIAMNIGPALDGLAKFVNDTLAPAWQSFVDGPLAGMAAGFDAVVSGIQAAADWLNSLAEQMKGIDLGVFMPGSPTPFEIGLRGANDALQGLVSDLPGLGRAADALGNPLAGFGATGAAAMTIPELVVGRITAQSLDVPRLRADALPVGAGAGGATTNNNLSMTINQAGLDYAPESALADLSMGMAML